MHELLELLLITPLAPLILLSRDLIMRVKVRNQACRLIMTQTVHVPIDLSIPTSHSSNPRTPHIFNASSTSAASLIFIFHFFILCQYVYLASPSFRSIILLLLMRSLKQSNFAAHMFLCDLELSCCLNLRYESATEW